MKETKDSSQRLNKAEKRWILYDVANSAFIMIVTATIPIYFRSLAEGSGMSGTSFILQNQCCHPYRRARSHRNRRPLPVKHLPVPLPQTPVC